MIIALKKGIRAEEQAHLLQWLENQGVRTHISEGEFQTIIGLVGDTTRIDMDLIRGLEFVDNVTRISEPFKKANRKFHPEDTVVRVKNCTAAFGGGNFGLIAGPCSVESEAQVFKPRTSPYDFQGLHEEGIRILSEVKKLTGLPIITEIMDISHLPLFEDVDIIQVGARNMQNFELLKELGRTDKPILLKRGLANNIKELLMSAEYIMAGGNEQVILCERGVRTFETYTRNTLDLSAVAVLHELSHLPVVVDPSHATGAARYVKPMALAAAACGADGLMIEVHNDPPHALCDGPQSLTPEQFADVAKAVGKIREAITQ